MAEKAIATGGASFHGHVHVETMLIEREKCVGVITNQGTVRADDVMLATNVWASVLPEQVGLRFPILLVVLATAPDPTRPAPPAPIPPWPEDLPEPPAQPEGIRDLIPGRSGRVRLLRRRRQLPER